MTDLADLIASLRSGTVTPADLDAAAYALAGKVKAKPLVWESDLNEAFGCAQTSYGGYDYSRSCLVDPPAPFRMCNPENVRTYHQTPDAAKAAAQADYEARILAALEPAKLTVADALTVPEMRALVDAANRFTTSYLHEDERVIDAFYATELALAAMRGIGGAK